MHRFQVLANSVLVGHTEFEAGDPPMGVAVGRFLPLIAYQQLQQIVAQREGKDVDGLHLVVRLTANEHVIECEGGVQITDYTPLGLDEIEVTALGIPYPLYAELFPEHVATYEKQFK